MKRFVGLIPVFPLALMLAGAAPALAQHFSDPDTLAPDFPTPQAVVERMLTVAQTRPGEMVYDLGCGDGRIVITAARQFKARAVGIEIRRDVYEKTLAHVASLGLSDQVRIVHGNA
ncbi:MAG TPA: class I SAM-dependent methyltransferase, partial [Bryobacteraceae bacterium]|nr:class I SAM-dependent methyltransferase [Bryobacteraceae bacterium]